VLRHELRVAVIDTAREMNRTGLNQGTSGNVSARVPGGFLITPSGVSYETLAPQDIVELHMDGKAAGPRRLPPSTEWRLHLDIYAARPDAGAIVHTHSMFAATMSVLRAEIPAVHYMIAVAGGSTVRCAPYATFGTPELAAHAVKALEDRKACLLANHGLVALGSDLPDAFRVAREIELVAAQYWRALQVGKPCVLDDEEMERVLQKFSTYGRARR
jgi:L-fuculose-phosphate aldolase